MSEYPLMDPEAYDDELSEMDEWSAEERIRVMASFDRLATILDELSWNEQSIQAFMTAIQTHITDETKPLTQQLEKGIAVADLKSHHYELWNMWSAGTPLCDVAATLNDPDHHSFAQLCMRIASIATKLGQGVSLGG